MVPLRFHLNTLELAGISEVVKLLLRDFSCKGKLINRLQSKLSGNFQTEMVTLRRSRGDLCLMLANPSTRGCMREFLPSKMLLMR